METTPLVPGASEPLKWTALVTALFVCIGGVLLGYDIGVANGALLPVSRHFDLNHQEMEIFVGVLNLMAVPGTIVGGWLADRFGRRLATATGGITFLVGNSMMAFAPSYIVLVAGRGIAGLAVGIALVTGPLYTAETAPARIRGMLVASVDVSYNVGILLGYVAGFAFSDLPDDRSWRWMFACGLLPPTLNLIGVFAFLRESPRWLAMKGRLHEAETVLHWLLGPIEAEQTSKKLKEGMDTKEESELSWTAAFSTSSVRGLLLIGCGVAFFSQATGVNTISYYSSFILHENGMDLRLALTITIFFGVIQVCASIVSTVLVDKVGRVPLLLASSLGMGLSMLMLGLAFMLEWPLWCMVAPMFTLIMMFSLGYAPVVYILNSEIYPKHCRSKGAVCSVSTSRITGGVVAITFLSLVRAVTYGWAFLFYACIGFIAAVFVYRVVTETKGTYLEEQDEAYRSPSRKPEHNA
eukprot:gnl/TRDRNA2_/TRDRNA2_81792_c0_seq1.p1 gnl/TRDRNA2_/TRDRNA2_81792_c0~~gnl/TRDRNA2_/TRDRNA2_81792_c0_seq1.p1  ORF type:complete len:467 (+),score=59.64 gnl/TRDRNA2_/TRDRNA2_81792_c0_seq1:249-1649(+)